jgi:hypothetical protein
MPLCLRVIIMPNDRGGIRHLCHDIKREVTLHMFGEMTEHSKDETPTDQRLDLRLSGLACDDYTYLSGCGGRGRSRRLANIPLSHHMLTPITLNQAVEHDLTSSMPGHPEMTLHMFGEMTEHSKDETPTDHYAKRPRGHPPFMS